MSHLILFYKSIQIIIELVHDFIMSHFGNTELLEMLFEKQVERIHREFPQEPSNIVENVARRRAYKEFEEMSS